MGGEEQIQSLASEGGHEWKEKTKCRRAVLRKRGIFKSAGKWRECGDQQAMELDTSGSALNALSSIGGGGEQSTSLPVCYAYGADAEENNQIKPSFYLFFFVRISFLRPLLTLARFQKTSSAPLPQNLIWEWIRWNGDAEVVLTIRCWAIVHTRGAHAGQHFRRN